MILNNNRKLKMAKKSTQSKGSDGSKSNLNMDHNEIEKESPKSISED